MITTLLDSKNRCLGKFLTISTQFLEEISSGDLSRIQAFQEDRDDLLTAIDLLDKKIKELSKTISPAQRKPEVIEHVKVALATKDRLVHEILEIDLRIMSLIEAEKLKIHQRLLDSRKGQSALSKFKSNSNDRGNEFDGIV